MFWPLRMRPPRPGHNRIRARAGAAHGGDRVRGGGAGEDRGPGAGQGQDRPARLRYWPVWLVAVGGLVGLVRGDAARFVDVAAWLLFVVLWTIVGVLLHA